MLTINLTPEELLQTLYAVSGEIACREVDPATLPHQKSANRTTLAKLRKIERKLEEARENQNVN